jgi:hypothetical protein
MTCLYGELGELDEAAEGAAQRLPVRHAHLVVAEPAHQPVEVLHVAHGGGEVLHVLGVLRTGEEGQRLLPVGDNFCTTEPSQGFSVNEWTATTVSPVVGVLDEPDSQLTPLIGVAVQARRST